MLVEPTLCLLNQAYALAMPASLCLRAALSISFSGATESLSKCLKDTSSQASPTIWSCHANLNHYHHSFLLKLIPYMVHKHRKICICMTKCQACFATERHSFLKISKSLLVKMYKKMQCKIHSSPSLQCFYICQKVTLSLIVTSWSI